MDKILVSAHDRGIHGRVWLRLLGWLELAQDVVLFGLVLGLYALMAWQLVAMWRHLREGSDVRAVLTDILYVLILVELFRVVMHYLGERHVAVGTMVEIAMISVLREIILRGPLEAPWPQLLVATALLAVLGLLYRFAGFHLGSSLHARHDVRILPDADDRSTAAAPGRADRS